MTNIYEVATYESNSNTDYKQGLLKFIVRLMYHIQSYKLSRQSKQTM